MIVDKVAGGVASVTMTKVEAKILHSALTVAKLQLGPNLLVGECHTETADNEIEHLRTVLSDIAKS